MLHRETRTFRASCNFICSCPLCFHHLQSSPPQDEVHPAGLPGARHLGGGCLGALVRIEDHELHLPRTSLGTKRCASRAAYGLILAALLQRGTAGGARRCQDVRSAPAHEAHCETAGHRLGGAPGSRPGRRRPQLRIPAEHGASALGHARDRRSVGPRRGGARPRGRAPRLRQDHRRPLRGPGLRARAGPPVADGAAAPHRPGPPVGDLRRAHLAHRRVPAHARLVRPRRALAGGAARRGQARAGGLRARGQRLSDAPPRLARAAASPRVRAAAAPAGAVEGGRQRRHRQADGAAALDQHEPRDPAPGAGGTGAGTGGDRGPGAARCRRHDRLRCPSSPSSIP